MSGLAVQLLRGAVGGIVATIGAMIAMWTSFGWNVLAAGAAAGSLLPATLAFAIAGVIVFTGDVSALRAALVTVAAHLAAIPVALPVALFVNPLTLSILPGTFTYVVAGVAIAALMCGGRVSLAVVGSAVAIVAASVAVPVQGGDVGWAMWFALVVAAWTIIPIAARQRDTQRRRAAT